MLSRGTVSRREIARQFGLNRGAMERHHASHVLRDVERAVVRENEKHQEEMRSVWEERLHDTYARAVEAGPKYLMVQSRLIDTGLRADGVIGEAPGNRSTVNIGHVIVMPSPKQLSPIESVIDVTALDLQSSDEDEEQKT